VIVVSPGQNVNFQVAQDLDSGGTVSNLYATGIPGGASSSNASGNPAISTLTGHQLQMIWSLCFEFCGVDNVGVQVFSSLLSKVLGQVLRPPTRLLEFIMFLAQDKQLLFLYKCLIQIRLMLFGLLMKGKNMSGQEIPLYSNASF
jgi:hypothetical protein